MNNHIREHYRLTKDSRYLECREFLNFLLTATIPPISLLEKLYNKINVANVQRLLDKLYRRYLFNPGNVRAHLDFVPQEIAHTRKNLEYNFAFQAIQSDLLLNKIPNSDDLEVIYGGYAETVRFAFSIFLKEAVKRKCGISSTAHHNRVGSLVNELGLNGASGFKYSAIGALHDVIEDLLTVYRDDKGRFGLERIYEFLDIFIPKELQEGTSLLTNYYDLILSHIIYSIKKKEKPITKDALLNELDYLTKSPHKYVNESAGKMHKLLLDKDLSHAPADYIKWMCYKNLFIKDMAVYTIQVNDFRTFQIKAIDLSDNAHGAKALSTEGRIRNICKLSFWANEGFELRANWMPLNNYIMELLDDALFYAETLVVADLVEEVSSLDFLTSAVVKIKKLEGIFYTNRNNS